jgi:hypothetical protein
LIFYDKIKRLTIPAQRNKWKKLVTSVALEGKKSMAKKNIKNEISDFALTHSFILKHL